MFFSKWESSPNFRGEKNKIIIETTTYSETFETSTRISTCCSPNIRHLPVGSSKKKKKKVTTAGDETRGGPPGEGLGLTYFITRR